MLIVQVGIAVLGVAAIQASQDERYSRRRWACVLGLLAQPAWFYETITAEQWGMVALSAAYTLAWLRGFHSYWWKGRPINCHL
jgi:hypothetical protein